MREDEARKEDGATGESSNDGSEQGKRKSLEDGDSTLGDESMIPKKAKN
jgi:hypothetical protein